jgi:hypothetical protein
MIRSLDDLVPVPELSRGDVHHFEEPELGWSVTFFAERLTITVYIYPLPLLRDSDVRPSAILAREFQAVKNEMFEAGRSRAYNVLPLRVSPGRVVPTKLDATALHESFLFQSSSRRDETVEPNARGSRFTEIILTMTCDQFIKLRCTYLPTSRRDGRTINRLLDALHALMP